MKSEFDYMSKTQVLIIGKNLKVKRKLFEKFSKYKNRVEATYTGRHK